MFTYKKTFFENNSNRSNKFKIIDIGDINKNGCKLRSITFKIDTSESWDEFIRLLDFRINCLIGEVTEILNVRCPPKAERIGLRVLLQQRRILGRNGDDPITLTLRALENDQGGILVLSSDVSKFPAYRLEANQVDGRESNDYSYSIILQRDVTVLSAPDDKHSEETTGKRTDLTVPVSDNLGTIDIPSPPMSSDEDIETPSLPSSPSFWVSPLSFISSDIPDGPKTQELNEEDDLANNPIVMHYFNNPK